MEKKPPQLKSNQYAQQIKLVQGYLNLPEPKQASQAENFIRDNFKQITQRINQKMGRKGRISSWFQFVKLLLSFQNKAEFQQIQWEPIFNSIEEIAMKQLAQTHIQEVKQLYRKVLNVMGYIVDRDVENIVLLIESNEMKRKKLRKKFFNEIRRTNL